MPGPVPGPGCRNGRLPLFPTLSVASPWPHDQVRCPPRWPPGPRVASHPLLPLLPPCSRPDLRPFPLRTLAYALLCPSHAPLLGPPQSPHPAQSSPRGVLTPAPVFPVPNPLSTACGLPCEESAGVTATTLVPELLGGWASRVPFLGSSQGPRVPGPSAAQWGPWRNGANLVTPTTPPCPERLLCAGPSPSC